MNETIDMIYNREKGVVSIEIEGRPVARMTFVFAGQQKIIIDHTEVTEGYNGRGYGKMMVDKAVELARDKQLYIVPLCPFARKVFTRNPEYGDVLYEEES